MEKNFEINLVKEVYKIRTVDGCYTQPYREYEVSFMEENYKVIVDDSIVGINSGKYTTLLYRLGGKKEQLIYKYEYELKTRKPYTFIYVDSDYSDIVGILEEKEIIKRIIRK